MAQRPDTEAGFSLLEVLIALFVLATAGLTSVSLMQTSTRHAGHAQSRALAALSAENMMNLALLEEQVEARIGRYLIAGREFEWTLEIHATDDPALVRLVLEVRNEPGQSPLARVQTFRRRPVA